MFKSQPVSESQRVSKVINIGLARINVERDGERSVVVDEFSQTPLQLHQALYLDERPFPTVFLKTPSSGLLGGDKHRIDVEVGRNSQLELRTQAATLVYPGHSSLTINMTVRDGAKLTFLPHALIFGAGSSLTQKVIINLEHDASLEYSDTWCAGRVAMNEAWQFENYSYSLELFRAGNLLYREHWSLSPQVVPFHHPLICGDYTHFSTLFIFGGRADREVKNVALPVNDWESSKTWEMRRDGDLVTKRSAKLR